MDDKLNWYAARTRYQLERRIKGELDRLHVENFVPFRKVIMERNGKRIAVERPVIPSLVFIRTDERTGLSLLTEHLLKLNYLRDHETGKFLVIPDKQMDDFKFLLDFSEEAVQVMNENLKRGDRVRVVKGEFAGIEGELVRIQGHKRVVVRLEGLFSLATTYIPGSFLERID